MIVTDDETGLGWLALPLNLGIRVSEDPLSCAVLAADKTADYSTCVQLVSACLT